MPIAGLAVEVRGTGGEFPEVKIEGNSLAYTLMVAYSSGGGYLYSVFIVVGNDVDHTAHSIASIEERGRAIQDLYTLDIGHIDALYSVVGDHPLPIEQEEYIAAFESIERDFGTHGVAGEGEGRGEFGESLLEGGDLG